MLSHYHVFSVYITVVDTFRMKSAQKCAEIGDGTPCRETGRYRAGREYQVGTVPAHKGRSCPGDPFIPPCLPGCFLLAPVPLHRPFRTHIDHGPVRGTERSGIPVVHKADVT
jgi:hypothetical protein